MERRFRPRQRQAPRATVRTLMVAGTASFIILGAVTAIVWQSFRKENATAGLPKVISDITVIRPESEIYRGTFNQPVLCIKIETAGEGKAPVLSNLSLSLTGTTSSVRGMLLKPQLFITDHPGFSSPSRLSVKTNGYPGIQFEIETQAKLESPVNYLWLTFDIANEVPPFGNEIIADCGGLVAGTLEYETTPALPSKGVRILPHKTWYSKSAGDLSAVSTWNSKRDGSGISPASFASDEEVFFIQSGCLLTNTLNACMPYLVIESGGTLQSSTGMRALNVTVEPQGVWNQTGVFSDPITLNHMHVMNGGNYIHSNSGKLPGRVLRMDPGSSAWFTDVHGLDSTNTAWGNVVIDLKEKRASLASSSLKNIQGSLEIKSGLLEISGHDSLSIGNDLVISGGGLVLPGSSDPLRFRVGRNLILKDGALTDRTTKKNTSGRVQLFIGKDVFITGGSLQMSSATCLYPGIAQGRPSRWRQQGGQSRLGNIVLLPGTAMVLESDTLGPITQGCSFTVMHDARLDAGRCMITGEGSFVLNKDALLAIGHSDGLNTNTDKGNIITRKRILSSDATYVYNSRESKQYTGDFKTVPEPDQVKTLRFFKASSSEAVLLQRNFQITDTFTLINGSVIDNGFTIVRNNEKQGLGKPQAGISAR